MTDKILLERDNVLSNLKFIGKLTATSKITLTPEMALMSDSFFNSIYRTFFGTDDRNSSLNFCRLNIVKSFEILRILKKSKLKSDIKACEIIIQDLSNAKTGIENLKTLYKSDIKLICNFDLLIQNIDQRLLDIEDENYIFDNVEDQLKQFVLENNNKPSPPTETDAIKTGTVTPPIPIGVPVIPIPPVSVPANPIPPASVPANPIPPASVPVNPRTEERKVSAPIDIPKPTNNRYN